MNSTELSGKLSPDREHRVLKHIHNNAYRRMTVAELADVAALSSSHFCRAFKATTGKTPKAMVRSVRAEKARKMLQITSLSLTAIALSVGYCSHSHFTSSFRRSFGSTPSQYQMEYTEMIRRRDNYEP